MQLLTRSFPQLLFLRQPVSLVVSSLVVIVVTFFHSHSLRAFAQESLGAETEVATSTTLADEALTEWDRNYFFPKNSLKWQSAEVRFVEGGRYRRDWSSTNPQRRAIHVRIPSRKHDPNLVIHLIKRSSLLSPSFKVVVHDGEIETEQPILHAKDTRSDCHFHGTVSSSYSNSRSRKKLGTNRRQGNAALSSCGASGGFRGVIMMDDGHWMIEPHPVANSSYSEKDPLPHIILPPESLQSNNFVSDELRVPKEELEAAALLAAAETKQRQRQREKEVNEERSTSSEQLVPTLLSPLFPHNSQAYGGHGPPIALAFATEEIGTVIESRKRIRTADTVDALQTVDDSGKKIIEMAVFTDEELYSKIKRKYPGDTTTKLKDYVTTMINTMDLLYRQPSLETEIEFRLVHLEILKKRPAKLNNNGGKAKAYLSSFCDFAGDKNANSGLWDHALLLTGLDLHEEGAKNTAGLAWAGTMCYRYYSCSISEGTSFGAAYIITHEIGHSLGLEHDGVGVSSKCDKDKFIMSPTTGPGKTNWSSCSSDNLKDFLQYGTSELRGRKAGNKPTCLFEIVSRSKKSIDFSSGTLLPGEKYDSGQQCLLAVGFAFRPYFQRNTPPFNDICWMLHCGNGTHAISTHPALEGTKCDKDKYCRKGKCVKRKRR